MSGNFYGANIEQLSALAHTMRDGADMLSRSVVQLSDRIESTPWSGNDYELFHTDWNSTHSPHLREIATRLTEQSDELEKHTAEQKEASAVHGPATTAAFTKPIVSSGSPVSASGGKEDTADGSREDERQDSRRDSGKTDDKKEGSTDGQAIPGPDPYHEGLGDPVNGTSAAVPKPPYWQPADVGSGEWNSEDASFGDKFKEWGVRQAANAASLAWPNAARNLHHYLANSGETLNQSVDTMLKDMPPFENVVAREETRIAQLAVQRAQESGITGPVTFPVNTEWAGFSANGVNKDWFLASGNYDYNINGSVTVYPPTTPGGEWRYEMESQVNYRDQYNWDGSKSTDILGITVTDAELQEFHRKGLAREFTMTGSSSTRTSSGTV